MTTRSGLLKAAGVCRKEWLETSSLCRCQCAGDLARRIETLATAELDMAQTAENWEYYEGTFETPSEHYGEHVFKRDLAGHWFRLKLPELPTERTAAQENVLPDSDFHALKHGLSDQAVNSAPAVPHAEHPLRHFDKTCPGCLAKSKTNKRNFR